jgi:ribosomal protein S18 acetylase RimI-like enzyme
MDTEISIRPATPGDLDALVPLLRVLFTIESDFRPDPERQRHGLARLLADRERCCVLAAERGTTVVGMVTAQLVVSTAEGAPSAWIEDVIVDAAERRRGLGGRLLAAVERWACERGATRLQLLVDRENAPAVRFYERLGWGSTKLVCLRRGGCS